MAYAVHHQRKPKVAKEGNNRRDRANRYDIQCGDAREIKKSRQPTHVKQDRFGIAEDYSNTSNETRPLAWFGQSIVAAYGLISIADQADPKGEKDQGGRIFQDIQKSGVLRCDPAYSKDCEDRP